MTECALVALGSNLPDAAGDLPLAICRKAVATLAAHPALTLAAVSPWYLTNPVPASDQPPFVNGVARFTTDWDADTLLALLHRIEADAGRTRSVRNAARTLDLDLLALGDTVVASPTLQLPHPRLHERAFVLVPLCDVAPAWRHPILGRSAADLRAAIDTAGIERLCMPTTCPSSML